MFLENISLHPILGIEPLTHEKLPHQLSSVGILLVALARLLDILVQ